MPRPKKQTILKTEKPVKKKTSFQSPKGMRDILPQEQAYWDKIEKTARGIADFYGFMKIDTPLLESAELFSLTSGEDSDVVSKEMFFVKGRSGGGDFVLRPEGTAPIARAYLQNGLSHISQPLKLYYQGPMFRREQPQAGRLRQFHQAGFEIIGSNSDPIYDAQVIVAMYRILQDLKIKNIAIQINSIGCRICRPGYRKKLIDYYRKHERELCVDCKERLKVNPLRLLDCKNASCAPFKEKAPSLFDNICAACSGHLKLVLEYLDELGIIYTLNPILVRGFDYYNKTVFEMFAGEDRLAIAAGGRYDYLIEMIGGRPAPGVGGALGIERIIEVLKRDGIVVTPKQKAKVFIVYIGDLAKKKTLSLIEEFRKAGIYVRESFGKDLIQRQMQLANKADAELAIILGQKEVYEETAIIRDLTSGAQESIPLRKVVDEVRRRLK